MTRNHPQQHIPAARDVHANPSAVDRNSAPSGPINHAYTKHVTYSKIGDHRHGFAHTGPKNRSR